MADVKKITDYLTDAVRRKVFPGCAAGWVVGGKKEIVVVGRHTYDDDSPAVTEDSLFDCASVTKSVPVGCIALRLIGLRRLGINDPLIKYVPEYRGSFRNDITIRHLLTHTLDFDFRLSEYKDLPPEKLIDSILGVKMNSPPGEKFHYANATSILLGMVIEAVCNKSLHAVAKEMVFDPLEMNDTTFFPSDKDTARCVPTEIDPWRGRIIRGEVHDESAWALRPIMTAGSAGMFSTVTDLLKFAEMLINMGRYGAGGSFCPPEIIGSMHTDQIPHISNQSTGLGWELDQEYMGQTRTPSTFGKTGFTGTSVIADCARKTGVVLLSNYTWPARKPNRDGINEVRARLADLING